MDDKGDFVVGLLVGGLVGVLVGLLVAPAPGQETRRRLAERAAETGGRVRTDAASVAGRVRSGAQVVGGRAAQSAQAVGRRVADQLGAVLDTVQQTVEDAVRGLDSSDGTAEPLDEAAAADGMGGPA